jgi:hypothetical protein
MTKIVVVYDERNNKLIPFNYLDNGEIVITSSGADVNHIRVKQVEANCVDWEGGYVYGKEEDARLL